MGEDPIANLTACSLANLIKGNIIKQLSV